MQIRSKQFRKYLTENGLLKATEAQIAEAKVEYKKTYLKEWKKLNIGSQREIRPLFSQKEFELLSVKASQSNMSLTSYVKNLALNSLSNNPKAPQKYILLEVMQALTKLATNSGTMQDLLDAEAKLLAYIKEH